MRFISCLILCLLLSRSHAQTIQPGFDAREYAQLLSLAFYSSSIPDSAARLTTHDPYHLEYRSPEVGLKNRWTLYLREDGVAVIDVRGTVADKASWLANFYAAMIPATGSLQLNDTTQFSYKLSADPKANVHVGWTVALAYLGPDVANKIREYHSKKKIKEFYIFGHSQGGAISFLLRSYLHYEQQAGRLPAEVTFKTYCSAAPKPGNMFYAYDYDFITRGGWGFNVVNAADWVPETPFSIQTINSLNPTNVFVNLPKTIKKQKFFVRLIGNTLYNKMERKPRKAQRKYEKYLGKKLFRLALRKELPGMKEPTYVHDGNYMRAGSPIILMPDSKYYELYPENPDKPFTHHVFGAYIHLLQKDYLVK